MPLTKEEFDGLDYHKVQNLVAQLEDLERRLADAVSLADSRAVEIGELQAAKAQSEFDHKEQVEKLTARHEADERDLNGAHEQELAALKGAHERQIHELVESHSREVLELKRCHRLLADEIRAVAERHGEDGSTRRLMEERRRAELRAQVDAAKAELTKLGDG